MKYKYKIYVVSDSHGNKCAAVADEPSDCVQIYGMRNKDGHLLFFESEAYHIEGWCKEFDLSYNDIDMDADV